MRFATFRAITFDVYGTLIDWEPRIRHWLAEWAAGHGLEVAAEDLIGRYDRARAATQRAAPTAAYPDIMRRSLTALAESFDRTATRGEQDAFAATIADWPPFADSVAALAALKHRFVLGALSNIDNASFRPTAASLGDPFDLVVTAEDVGDYKPALPHFERAFRLLADRGIGKPEILHVAQSLRADIAPANRLGLSCIWVARPGGALGVRPSDAAGAAPDLTVASLEELLTLMRAEGTL